MKTISITLSLLLYTCIMNAQQSDIKGRWNIKAGYSSSPSGFKEDDKYVKINYIMNEVNFGFTNTLEAGLYGGCGITMGDYFSNTSQVLYGAKANLHILPLFVNTHNMRIDLYVSGSLGGAYRYLSTSWLNEKSSFFTWSLDAGASYYFKPHVGIYIEAGVARSIEENYFKLSYGLTFKF